MTFVIGNMTLVSFSLLLDASPPRPKIPFGQRHGTINIYNIFKGHNGSRGGGAFKNKLKDTSFIFPLTNITILGLFRMHAQKEYGKVFEIKSTYILNVFALLSYRKQAMHLLKV